IILYIIPALAAMIFMVPALAAETCVAPELCTVICARNSSKAPEGFYDTWYKQCTYVNCQEDGYFYGALSAYESCLQSQQQELERQKQLEQQRQRELELEQQRQQELEQQRKKEEEEKLRQQSEPSGGAIAQPVRELKKELETPGPSVPLPPPVITSEPPAPKGEIVNIEYIQAGREIKKGAQYSTPKGKNVSIAVPAGTIHMKDGSSLQYTADDMWRAIKGKFKFLIDRAKSKRFRVSSSNAVTSVRGTYFLVDIVPEGTQVKTLKGSVEVTDDKGKRRVEVKEGFQTLVDKKGPSKPTRFDAAKLDKWYKDLPPAPAFFDESWKKTAAANLYKKECATTAGLAKATAELNADEQATLEQVNAILPKVRLKEVNVIDEKAKKIYVSRDKTDADGQRSAGLYFNSKKIYYPGSKANTWKAFNDQEFINGMFSSAREQNLTYIFDKKLFKFLSWSNDLLPTAGYAGSLSAAGNASFIQSTLGAAPEEGQSLAAAKVFFDEETKLLNKYEIEVMIQSGKLEFPIKTTCKVSYGGAAKITLPAKFQSVKSDIGKAELQKVIQSVQ
ncbi:MAG: FecR domain-containing protein, partial [Parcubacteria group bacterium]|nr:FecR domain-containing protein [Parcubacteria group bacterium]